MDFCRIKQSSAKRDSTRLYPDFIVGRSRDLMIRGQSFYAIWDEEAGMWSTDEYDVQRLVDETLYKKYEEIKDRVEGQLKVEYMSDFSTGSWRDFRAYMKNVSDNAHQLDENLTFANTEVKKKDYVSKRLSYPLEEGSIDAYDELIGTLYIPEERAKIEWAIGAIVSGDSKDIQKFLVLYGEMGSGKSTILNVIAKLFDGYYAAFEAKALASSNNAFATEVFKSNPLVAIQHDGDLSRIEDNTKLNSIISHEYMTMNEKYKPSYTARINSFLFMGSNRPVKITDAKSGIIRRLIDVTPSGKRIPPARYQTIMQQIDFELGAIAYHCLQVYRKMGKNYYANYKPLSMMFQTDVFFNFVEAHYFEFKEAEGVTLKRAWEMYKVHCEETLIDYPLPRYRFRDELKNYFKSFDDMVRIDGKQIRSYYSGFMSEKFKNLEPEKEERQLPINLDAEYSIFDDVRSESQAQYASQSGTPSYKWDDVTTKLKDLDTTKLHYVRPPENHIVVDFDLTNDDGEKDLMLNLEAASKFPPTYTELSRSGKGVHLHYIYDGDTSRLSRVFDDGIEVKVFNGNSSLRRQLTKCNNVPIETINSGLPLRGEPVINFEAVKSEKRLRHLIERNLKKEIHPGTKPSVDFIDKILTDAYNSGLSYDVTDMRPHILAFANNSTNQAKYCLGVVSEMKYKSEEPSEGGAIEGVRDEDLVFFDVEVYPNLFLIIWKKKDGNHVVMLNPTPQEVEPLLALPLVGQNNRRYDNHILYARYLGYTNEQLYVLSQKIIANSKNAFFAEAYGLSYIDIYEMASKKQSLAKWQIELGINHIEMDIPWDQPVPKELIPKVIEYCKNDVDATEYVFNHLRPDYTARKILAELSGLPVNDTTQRHAARIIFGTDKNAQQHFVYTDLSEEFPGYTFDFGKSQYRGENPSEGGYVYSEPGLYENVAILDIASMHPTSAVQLNIFGKYTKRFNDLIQARLAIKHKNYDSLKTMLNGMLVPYITDDDVFMGELSYALKIVINIVYGMTSAKFDNPFRDNRNKDNIVAKRGALFMIDLKHTMQAMGVQVVHIKTDSIKITNPTEEIIEFIKEFGKTYGYDFEHEDTYSKFGLVNDAVYVAKNQKKKWEAVGAQFQHPYVYKTLLTKEKIIFEDMRETKGVKTTILLDMNNNPEERRLVHIGKVGQFTPVDKSVGGTLLRQSTDGETYHAVTGTKGYTWLTSIDVQERGIEDKIDKSYYTALVDKAIDTLNKFGDAEQFLEGE